MNTPQNVFINTFDMFGKNLFSLEQADKISEIIDCSNLPIGATVTISFKGIKIVTSEFMSALVRKLFPKYSKELSSILYGQNSESPLKFADLNSFDFKLLKASILETSLKTK